MNPHHLEIGAIKDNKLYIDMNAWAFLRFKSNPLDKKAISVYHAEIFTYKPKEKHAIYIFEVGLPEIHADTLQDNISIYVRSLVGKHKDRTVVCTLSKAQPNVRLGLVLPDEFELSHSASRKIVHFNAYEVKKRSKRISQSQYISQIETDKLIWVAKLKASQSPEFHPNVEGKKYHLLKVYKTKPSPDITLYAEYKGVKRELGTISDDMSMVDCVFEFDDTFRLSHNSKTASVTFSGYTVACNQSFELEDLASNSDVFMLKPPKEVVDDEYLAYRAVLAKRNGGTASIPSIKQGEVLPLRAPVFSESFKLLRRAQAVAAKRKGGTASKQAIKQREVSPIPAPVISLSTVFNGLQRD